MNNVDQGQNKCLDLYINLDYVGGITFCQRLFASKSKYRQKIQRGLDMLLTSYCRLLRSVTDLNMDLSYMIDIDLFIAGGGTKCSYSHFSDSSVSDEEGKMKR